MTASSAWYIAQWNKTAYFDSDDLTKPKKDPLLGTALYTLAAAGGTSGFSVYQEPGHKGRYAYEISGSNGVATAVGSSNTFISTIAPAAGVTLDHPVVVSLDARVAAASVTSGNAQFFAGVTLNFNNPGSPGYDRLEPTLTAYVQSVISASSPNFFGGPATFTLPDGGAIESGSLPGETALPYQTSKGGFQNVTFDVNDYLAALLNTRTAPGGAWSAYTRNLSQWSVQGVYVGLEMSGKASMNVQVANISVETDSAATGAAAITEAQSTVAAAEAVTKMSNKSNACFDAAYYLANNPDVKASGMDPWQHYLRYGWKEGRNPNAWFNESYYWNQNPDVKAAAIDPLLHYEQYGWKEGRNPSYAFNTDAYLRANPDVAAAGMDPLQHYMTYGVDQGRMTFLAPPHAVGTDDPLVNGSYYYAANPDVEIAGMDATIHYTDYGWHEGRNPDALFNTKYYLAMNPDVKASGMDPLLHYEEYGWKEGRNPSAQFDTGKYLAANPDVAAAHMDPLLHYELYGNSEGRAIFAV